MNSGGIHDVVETTEKLGIVVDVDFRQQSLDVSWGKHHTSAHHVVLGFSVANRGRGPAVAMTVPCGDPPKKSTSEKTATSPGKQPSTRRII